MAFCNKTQNWLGIKNDYRTLIGFEGVNVVKTDTELDEDEDGE